MPLPADPAAEEILSGYVQQINDLTAYANNLKAQVRAKEQENIAQKLANKKMAFTLANAEKRIADAKNICVTLSTGKTFKLIHLWARF
jgi:ppGpp synthetase/RelA/SpoT-type nucleotidyltranferase